MALTKSKKQDIFSNVEDIVTSSKSVVFVNFHKLPVSESTKVRRELKNNGITYVVAKKTITKKVLEKKGLKGTMPELPGELALAYSSDLIAPAREIYRFQKEMDKRISILGGIFDGVLQSKEEMIAIAAIPSQKVLYGMFVNLINSPIQGFAVALNAIAEKKQ